MTDRINSLTVVLKHEVREDDAEKFIDALRMFDFVVDVLPGSAEPIHIARAQVRAEMSAKLWKALEE